MATFSLAALKSYSLPWVETSRELLKKLQPKEFKNIKSATVTEKEMEWGMSTSVCMLMKDNTTKYVSLSRDSQLEVGDKVDLDTLEIIGLERDGEEIFKADGEALED